MLKDKRWSVSKGKKRALDLEDNTLKTTPIIIRHDNSKSIPIKKNIPFPALNMSLDEYEDVYSFCVDIVL